MQDPDRIGTARGRMDLRFWLITFAALLAIVLTASLGRWQLARAAQKVALQAAIDERGRAPALSNAELLGMTASGGDGTQAVLHRAVRLQGQWEDRATVFLDNRQMYGRPGFFVLTPLRLAPAAAGVVLVQRGWVPRDFVQRTRLPDVPAASGPVVVEGRIAGAPARLYDFAPAAGEQGFSRIRQNLDLAAYAAETGLPLLPLSVVQTGEPAERDGLSRDWPAVDTGVDKHYGYAFQWFGLCALVTLLYVWFQLFRRFARPRH